MELENGFETAVVNEPPVFEPPLKFYCIAGGADCPVCSGSATFSQTLLSQYLEFLLYIYHLHSLRIEIAINYQSCHMSELLD